MNVVLNTDNRLMSGTTLTDEYVHAAKALGFSFDELSEIALNGFAERVSPLGRTRAADHAARAEIAALAGGRGVTAPFGAAQARQAADAIRARLGGASRVAAIVLGQASAGSPTRSNAGRDDSVSRHPRLSDGDGGRPRGRADRGPSRGEARCSRSRGGSTCTRDTTCASPRFPRV